MTAARAALLTPGRAGVDPTCVGVSVFVGLGESGQPCDAAADTSCMFHFQTLDVYKCAVTFLPIGYALAGLGDGEMASRSALECAAVLDAMHVVGITDHRIADGHVLLVGIVSMLTKMIG